MSVEDFLNLPCDVIRNTAEDQWEVFCGVYTMFHPTVNVIRKSEGERHRNSPCNSPIWPVRKADKISWHLTVDYRELNKVTPRLALVVAKFPETMAVISSGVQWYSVLDLSNVFFSISMDPQCHHIFAFTYGDTQLTFTRVPQELHNARHICHKHISEMWKHLDCTQHVVSYVDDVLIATRTEDENLGVFDKVLKIIKEMGFIINPEKAQLVKQQVTYLGVQLGPAGRSPDKNRIE
ncbi:unnamed protein product [Lepidochelys kempii]